MKKYSFYKNWPESCVHDLHLAIIVFIRFGLGNISLVTVFEDLFLGVTKKTKPFSLIIYVVWTDGITFSV